MHAFYQAYRAYERKVMRGEFGPPLPRLPLAVRLGDLLIRTGVRLKAGYSSDQPLNRTYITRSTS